MSFLGLMQSTCTIQRETEGIDSRGIVTPTWADASTGVRCQLIQLSAKEVMATQGWGIEIDYKVLMPAGTIIRSHPPDRVIIDSLKYLAMRVDPQRGRTLIAWVKRQD